nr:hypothetical protein [Tanacetum cinerariifolium]
MSTSSSSFNLVLPFIDPESVIRARRRDLGDPSRLLDFEEINMNPNKVQGPPPAGPPHQNHNGPPGPNIHMLALDLRMMEELLTLRHRDTINAAARRTFMKKRPKECYDLIENMTTYHNDWDTSAHRVNSVTPTCETCGGPHSYYECQAADGYTQDVYATSGTYNTGGGGTRTKDDNGPVLIKNTIRVPPSVVQSPLAPTSFKIPPPLISIKPPKRNPHQPLIPYPSKLNKQKLPDKSDIQVHKFFKMLKKFHFNNSLAEALALMPKYHKMLKEILSDKEKLLGFPNTSLTENCSAKKLSLPDLTPTRMALELATRSIAYPAGIAEDICIQVGKFTFPADFVVVDYDINPRFPLILGRPFLRTARALVDVYGEELILRDGDETLIFHADSTSKHPQKNGNESINMISFIDITYEDRFPKVLNIKKSNHSFSGSTTSSDSSPSLTPFETGDSLLKEFANEVALLGLFPPRNKDDNFDPEADLREIKYLLNRDPSTNSSPTTDIDIIDPILERFTNEHALIYSSPPREDDDDDDDLFDLKSDNDECKKLFDSTLSEESSESSEIATLFSPPFENENKVFNPGIHILGRTQILNDESKAKNLKVNTSSKAPLILKEHNFPSTSSHQELLSHLELSVTETLLSFSSENKDKVFNPEILTSKGVH